MRRDRWGAATATALVLLAALPGRAGSAGRFRMAVRIASQSSRALFERLRGQTSDIDLDLVEVETPPLEATRPMQLGSAAGLARRYQADAVVWFDDANRASGEGHVVLVLQPEAKRLLVRAVGDRTGDGKRVSSTSAELETAAVIVRVAARAILEGQPIGVETPLPPSNDAARVAPAPAARERAPAARERAPASSATPPAWSALALLGWHSAIDGTSPSGQHGLAVRLGLSSSAFSGGVSGVLGIGAEISDPAARFHVSRHALALWAEAAVIDSEQASLALGAVGGVTQFRRTTIATANEAIAAPASAPWILFFGPEVRTTWRPDFTGGHGGIALIAGCDIIPQAPVLGYNVSGTFTPSRRFWSFEPHLELALELRGR